jgi:hypothetical protein
LGFVYSPKLFGRDRITVIRAGYGIFYDQILGAVVSQSRNVYPSFFTLNFGGGPFSSTQTDLPLELFNPVTTSFGNLLIPIVSPGSLNRLNPQLPLSTLLTGLASAFPTAISPTLPARGLQMPSAQHYAVTFEQQLARNLVLSTAYVGTQGRHLLRFTTPNLGPALNLVPTILNTIRFPQFDMPFFLGRGATPARPTLGLGAVNIFETTATSQYDAFQVQLRGRFHQSFEYQTSYTLSSARDDVSDVFDLAGAFALPQNSSTLAGEWSASNFDARHRLAFNFIYTFGSSYPSSRAARILLSGLKIAGTGRLQTGQPFTVNSTIDVNQDGNLTDRLDNTNGLVVTGNARQPLILTTNNPLSLLAPFGQDGAIHRNTFRAGGLVQLDLAISKNFVISKDKFLTFRVEVFNFLDRTNFGVPNRFLEAPGFGQSSNTTTPGSRAQVSLKYDF